ncbi:unnamed protein product [Clonostachys rosea]|uniref:Uncharacterized protein n=1 Tax=Bionectria ochroleuca TaxID=29856 RepID=A0ABY6UCL8_BIOOC|nr:unnamed protein product [Clonostachys rosea]
MAFNSQTFEADTRNAPEPPTSGNLNTAQTFSRGVSHTRSRSSPIAPARRHIPERKDPQPSNNRDSTFSTDTGESKGRPQRKKSTLRGALGKIFSRRKKTSSQTSLRLDGSNIRPVQGRLTSHHRSTTFDVSVLSNYDDYGAKRSASVPPGDYGRALRSHSIGPEDVLAIESARVSAQADRESQKRRYERSSVHSFRELTTREGEPAGLAPRPVTVYGGSSVHETFPFHDGASAIGRAITSDQTGLKRRSRSLSAIGDAVLEGGDLQRTRSTEIRYWRQSHDTSYKPPMSPPDAIQTQIDGGLYISSPEQPQSPVSPLQSFTFGDVGPAHLPPEVKSPFGPNLDSKLGNLERRTKRLEKAMSELSHSVPDFRFRPDPSSGPPVSYKPTNGNGPMNWGPTWFDNNPKVSSRPSTGRSGASSKSSLDLGPAYYGSNRRLIPQPALGIANRPLSTTTIRGVASLPSISQEYARPLTTEHYITLMALLETERSARQALEAQVKTMGYQISVMAKSLSNDFPASKPSISEQSAFDYDDEEEDELHRGANNPMEATLVPQDSGLASASPEEDEISPTYVTPNEEANDEGLVMRAKTDRTLSLSRITMSQPGPGSRPDLMHSPI